MRGDFKNRRAKFALLFSGRFQIWKNYLVSDNKVHITCDLRILLQNICNTSVKVGEIAVNRSQLLDNFLIVFDQLVAVHLRTLFVHLRKHLKKIDGAPDLILGQLTADIKHIDHPSQFISSLWIGEGLDELISE